MCAPTQLALDASLLVRNVLRASMGIDPEEATWRFRVQPR